MRSHSSVHFTNHFSRVESVLEFLQGCTSPEEKELAIFIESRGGRDVVLKSERLLLELISQRPRANNPSADGRWPSRQSTLDLRALKEELSEEPEISVSRNWATFERKFEMQEKGLERVQEIIHEDNQVIVESVTAGPHDKIGDNVSAVYGGLRPDVFTILSQDLYNIWRGMVRHLPSHYRGLSLTLHHFVLAMA